MIKKCICSKTEISNEMKQARFHSLNKSAKLSRKFGFGDAIFQSIIYAGEITKNVKNSNKSWNKIKFGTVQCGLVPTCRPLSHSRPISIRVKFAHISAVLLFTHAWWETHQLSLVWLDSQSIRIQLYSMILWLLGNTDPDMENFSLT